MELDVSSCKSIALSSSKIIDLLMFIFDISIILLAEVEIVDHVVADSKFYSMNSNLEWEISSCTSFS